jgi:hypothetical protein
MSEENEGCVAAMTEEERESKRGDRSGRNLERI